MNLDTHAQPTNIRGRVETNDFSIHMRHQPVTDDRGLVRVSFKLLKKQSQLGAIENLRSNL